VGDTLWVDLDGTLILQDSSLECIKKYVKLNGLRETLFLIKECKFRKFQIKDTISNRIDLSSISWRKDSNLEQYLQKRFDEGDQINLITAAPKKIAHFFAQQHLFTKVYFSTASNTMKGIRKIQIIQTNSRTNNFYFGNSFADIIIWKHLGVANISKQNKKMRIALFLIARDTKVKLF